MLRDGTTVQKPPNNWESQFKGSAWQYDAITDEWYLRLFAKEQPDLNWSNPEVREAVYEGKQCVQAKVKPEISLTTHLRRHEILA